MCQRQLEWQQIYDRLKCNRDDDIAWQALERRVRAWLRADYPDASDVLDDAVAEVLAGVCLSFGRARGPETFRGFVYGHRLNVRRRMWSRLNAPVMSLERLANPLTLVRVDGHAPEAVGLDEAVEALPPRERHAVTLRYFENLGTDQLAAALGVSEGNARQIIFQALTRLRRNRVLLQAHARREAAA